MEYGTLFELIHCLQYGTNLHIGVLFFNDYGNEHCRLPFPQTIHSREVCDAMKQKSRQAFRCCFACRNLAIKKALTGRKAFGGICINGVYEYTHPVVIRGDVACIIFIGNILADGAGSELLKKRLGPRTDLLETLERNCPERVCSAIAGVVERYILFLLDSYGFQSKREHPLIENIKSYLQANLEYDISLSHIAAVFHYNEQYLGRLFKKHTGRSLREFVLQQRLSWAGHLLCSSQDPIIEIANRVGFNNVTYFNRQFKAVFGMTPSQYRSRNREPHHQ